MEEDNDMLENQLKQWDAQYDVIVVGFGGAGATAARFAADNGAKVLLVDSAPKGHEGGNTRYCGQLIMSGTDETEIRKYYLALNGPMNHESKITDAYTKNLAHMQGYLKKYLGVKPVSVRELIEKGHSQRKILEPMTPEYPELPGADNFDFLLVHEQFSDGALWKILRQKVVDRSEKIDVWFETPAKHLIQANDGKKIKGIQVDRAGNQLNIEAKNGVILTLGGFENNKDMIQNYVGEPMIGPIGTLYNQGKGIDLAIEAGADLWHMQATSGLTNLLKEKTGQRPSLVMGPALTVGSVIRVGDDGTRYQNENKTQRHGYLSNHGLWRVPHTQVQPFMIFDQTQHEEMVANKIYQPLLDAEIKDTTIAGLATMIKVPADKLARTVSDFNEGFRIGSDEFKRELQTMRKFDEGPYYAVPLGNFILNTQGGPRRNERAEVVGVDQQPIPGLYAAGELGSIWGGQYQGGGNISDCLIFGKIAGENAATKKKDLDDNVANQPKVKKIKVTSDIQPSQNKYVVKENQYIGKSQAGMGDDIVVRVTITPQDKNLKKIEILQQSETGELGTVAVNKLSHEMIEKNTPDVAVISGASISSNAIKEAVKNALSQIK
ncbi:fumarate reductase, flavoprotein subunit precursor [Ligilactobacillus pobuzihii E100301 = KCTC 13174]|uniref:Urocanate reductase n=2 Tax=Ligilactobacillus pobuzihii TaxID=449659 RepID=A0A0R2LAD8_9LACO|nr:fumarate reductase, flavoprotein subunit precursor [Ligilactobacillus pobuzihii E100301 = KCTC 13174]KRN98496.1 fumarate reductase, flavoprotein subunit precursor [Ligilactobacillus pobuzihii]